MVIQELKVMYGVMEYSKGFEVIYSVMKYSKGFKATIVL